MKFIMFKILTQEQPMTLTLIPIIRVGRIIQISLIGQIQHCEHAHNEC